MLSWSLLSKYCMCRSPEAFDESAQQDHKTDIWALGWWVISLCSNWIVAWSGAALKACPAASMCHPFSVPACMHMPARLPSQRLYMETVPASYMSSPLCSVNVPQRHVPVPGRVSNGPETNHASSKRYDPFHGDHVRFHSHGLRAAVRSPLITPTIQRDRKAGCKHVSCPSDRQCTHFVLRWKCRSAGFTCCTLILSHGL